MGKSAFKVPLEIQWTFSRHNFFPGSDRYISVVPNQGIEYEYEYEYELWHKPSKHLNRLPAESTLLSKAWLLFVLVLVLVLDMTIFRSQAILI